MTIANLRLCFRGETNPTPKQVKEFERKGHSREISKILSIPEL